VRGVKLATMRDGTRDGRLHVVRRDGRDAAPAPDRWPTLQRALDEWTEAEPALRAVADALAAGSAPGTVPVDLKLVDAPLPRAYEWVDGSAFLNHVRLVRKARGAEPPPTLETDPLIYQGGSSEMLGPTEPFVLPDPAYGLDFESEIGVILGDTPQGTTAERAPAHIRLVVLLNDWTCRALVPDELAKGFGFFQGKPATGFAPFAVTPDELGAAWKDTRAHLRVQTRLNGAVVGDVDAGPEMHFSFARLVEHITKTRAFTAGTILGSGTVSNADRARGISCLAERRMIETIDAGKPATPWLAYGDVVRVEAFAADGASVFGAIEAAVARPEGSGPRDGEPEPPYDGRAVRPSGRSAR
jgi:fumarylacetoacetate (FAA) hydrolase